MAQLFSSVMFSVMFSSVEFGTKNTISHYNSDRRYTYVSLKKNTPHATISIIQCNEHFCCATFCRFNPVKQHTVNKFDSAAAEHLSSPDLTEMQCPREKHKIKSWFQWSSYVIIYLICTENLVFYTRFLNQCFWAITDKSFGI